MPVLIASISSIRTLASVQYEIKVYLLLFKYTFKVLNLITFYGFFAHVL